MTPAEKVRSRGHWFITVRPMPHDPDRVAAPGDLEAAVRRSAVRIRGWDYPHVSNRYEVNRFPSYIEQGTDWEYHVEYWRYYKSGQFVHWNGIRDDWHDQSTLWPSNGEATERVIGVLDTVYTMLEVLTFAGRLALGPGGSDEMSVRAELKGAEGRRLRVDERRRAGFDEPRVSRVDSIEVYGDFRRDDLVSCVDEPAVNWSRAIFAMFHWDPTTELLRDLVAEARRDSRE